MTTTMPEETTKKHATPSRAEAAEAIEQLITTLSLYLARQSLDAVLVIARIVALLPTSRAELVLGFDSPSGVDFVMRLPGAQLNRSVHGRSELETEPYVIEMALATVRGLDVRVQCRRRPTPDELAKLKPAEVDTTPRVRSVALPRSP